MTPERIKEIQQSTAYPESLSVQQALLQVWNECGQEASELLKQNEALVEFVKSIGSNYVSLHERANELLNTLQK